MKAEMLLIATSPTTKVGLYTYLNNIFGQYLSLEACLTGELTTEYMEKFELVVFASQGAFRAAEPMLTPKIHYFMCIRAFNFTYLSKILMIPSGSKVYLVNDSESTTRNSIEQLKAFGFTQYHFIPWYPGCGSEPDYSIPYAVTLGEGRYAPKHIADVIDIGARVADISTVSEIAGFFKLPMSLADMVTRNYISQFVQLLKISNHQISQAANIRFITQSIISNIASGVCLVDARWMISMVNKPFLAELGVRKKHLIGLPVTEVLPEIAEYKNAPSRQFFPNLIVRRQERELSLTVQIIQSASHETMFLIHSGKHMELYETGGPSVEEGREASRPVYQFSDYHTEDEQTLKILETARRISLTDYSVLIQGETGTGKEVLAQAIHNNSSRSKRRFVKLSLACMSGEAAAAAFQSLAESPGAGQGMLGGTLFLDNVHCLDGQLQKELLYLIDQKPDIRFIASTSEDLFEKCRNGSFMQELFFKLSEVSLQTLPIRRRTGDIPLLLESALRNIYNNPSLLLNELCTEILLQNLTSYQWPGNGREIENLCKYFYCVKTDRKLMSRDLPPYIREQITERKEKLVPMDRQLLELLYKNPGAGRAKLCQMITDGGMEASEGKLRGHLQSLAERGFIKMNRTRGGCEITEEGLLLL